MDGALCSLQLTELLFGVFMWVLLLFPPLLFLFVQLSLHEPHLLTGCCRQALRLTYRNGGKVVWGSKREITTDKKVKYCMPDSNLCQWTHTSLLSLSIALSCCLFWSSSCAFSLWTASLSFSFSSRLRASSSRSRPSLEFSRLVSSSCCLSFLVSSCCSCSASTLWDVRSCSWDYRHTDNASEKKRKNR